MKAKAVGGALLTAALVGCGIIEAREPLAIPWSVYDFDEHKVELRRLGERYDLENEPNEAHKWAEANRACKKVGAKRADDDVLGWHVECSQCQTSVSPCVTDTYGGMFGPLRSYTTCFPPNERCVEYSERIIIACIH